jgi:predicted RNA binding protein YcfA (HicA-like mRNA interferase family)
MQSFSPSNPAHRFSVQSRADQSLSCSASSAHSVHLVRRALAPNPSLNSDVPYGGFARRSGPPASSIPLGRALGALRRSAHNCGVKVSEILRLLNADGWYLVMTRGSHRQFKHPSKRGRVTVPGKPSDELAPGTLNSIRKQAGFKK